MGPVKQRLTPICFCEVLRSRSDRVILIADEDQWMTASIRRAAHYLGHRDEIDGYIAANRIPTDWAGKRFDAATRQVMSQVLSAVSY